VLSDVKYNNSNSICICTLRPASAWVGDRLWTGKPPRRRTRHPGTQAYSA